MSDTPTIHTNTQNNVPLPCSDSSNRQYNIFIIDFWIPFPSSEYGGIVIVIAKNENDAINCIANKSWEHGMDHDIKARMETAVRESMRFELLGEHETKIVYDFIT